MIGSHGKVSRKTARVFCEKKSPKTGASSRVPFSAAIFVAEKTASAGCESVEAFHFPASASV